MMTVKDEMRPVQRIAKMAGFLYLVIAVLAGFVHFYIPGLLVVPGDAATTANNIIASEGLFRIGMATELVLLLSEVALSILLYVLLKPVNQTLSLIAAASRLVMTTIHGFNLISHAIVLVVLSGTAYLTVFEPNQLQALVLLLLDAYSSGFTLGIVFLALHALPLGYLIYRSGYFPKALGVLFMLAAVGYTIDGFSYVLLDNYKVGPVYLALPIAISEIAFPLWLLIKGVNAEQWLRLKGANLQRQSELAAPRVEPVLAPV
jgi:hypothetical protein